MQEQEQEGPSDVAGGGGLCHITQTVGFGRPSDNNDGPDMPNLCLRITSLLLAQTTQFPGLCTIPPDFPPAAAMASHNIGRVPTCRGCNSRSTNETVISRLFRPACDARLLVARLQRSIYTPQHSTRLALCSGLLLTSGLPTPCMYTVSHHALLKPVEPLTTMLPACFTLIMTLAASVTGLALPAPQNGEPPTSPTTCTASHWTCNGAELQVCSSGRWLTAAYCSKASCCTVSNGGLNAHCYC